MNALARLIFGDDAPPNPLALIVDLDDTVCTQFTVPIRAAVDVLRRVDRQKVTVHYVSARGEVAREGTVAFLAEHRLPGWRNLHLCPNHLGSPRHKLERHRAIAREYRVIASIGDYDPDEGAAARAVGVPFVLVAMENAAPAWAAVADLIEAAGGFSE